MEKQTCKTNLGGHCSTGSCLIPSEGHPTSLSLITLAWFKLRVHLVSSVQDGLCEPHHCLWLFYTENQIATQPGQLRMSKTWNELSLVVKHNSFLCSTALPSAHPCGFMCIFLTQQNKVANTSHWELNKSAASWQAQ